MVWHTLGSIKLKHLTLIRRPHASKDIHQTNQPSYSTVFYLPSLAVAIDLIFFKVKNMYHTPALAAIFAGWVYLGLIRKTKQFGAITCLGIFISLFFFASGTLF